MKQRKAPVSARTVVQMMDEYTRINGTAPLIAELSRTRRTACVAWGSAGFLLGACSMVIGFTVTVLA